MANIDAAFGLRPVGEVGSGVQNGGTTLYTIVDNYATSIFKGDHVMFGYVNNYNKADGLLKDGWLNTGDLGSKRKNGYYFLEGRKDDMINIFGLKIYPFEIEKILMDHPFVKEAVVVYNENLGGLFSGRLIALVVLNSSSVEDSELKSHCSKYLEPYKIPSHYKFIKNIPKSKNGKILRNKLKELLINNGPD